MITPWRFTLAPVLSASQNGHFYSAGHHVGVFYYYLFSDLFNFLIRTTIFTLMILINRLSFNWTLHDLTPVDCI